MQRQESRRHPSLERWWREHSDLDRLVSELDEALGCRSPGRASEAFSEFADALRSHFTLEENVYFPLVERLRPETAPMVREARLAHLDLLRELEGLEGHLAAEDIPAARSSLGTLLSRFRHHEKLEGDIIHSLREAVDPHQGG